MCIINYGKNSDFGFTLVVDVDYAEYINRVTKLVYIFDNKKLYMSHYIITTSFKTWMDPKKTTY